MHSIQIKGHKAVAMLALAALILCAHEASAFSFNTTSSDAPVRWNKERIEVILDESLGEVCEMDEAENVIAAAFDEWVDMANLPLQVEFVRGKCKKVGQEDHSDRNCVKVDPELFADTANVGATTLVSYVLETGAIRDVDIVINPAEGLWKCGDVDGKVELAAAMLHEVGHFIGMAHSEIDEAVMAPLMSPGSEPVALHEDDMEGAASLYDGLDMSEDVSCSIASAGRGNGGLASVLFVLSMLGLLLVASKNR